MQPITLNCDRPAIELTQAGETVRWEYDVVELKIAFEGLEKQHKLASRDVLSSPSASFLQDAATVLQGKGLEGCTPDIALRVYSVVRIQFKKIVADLAKQLSE